MAANCGKNEGRHKLRLLTECRALALRVSDWHDGLAAAIGRVGCAVVEAARQCGGRLDVEPAARALAMGERRLPAALAQQRRTGLR